MVQHRRLSVPVPCDMHLSIVKQPRRTLFPLRSTQDVHDGVLCPHVVIVPRAWLTLPTLPLTGHIVKSVSSYASGCTARVNDKRAVIGLHFYGCAIVVQRKSGLLFWWCTRRSFSCHDGDTGSWLSSSLFHEPVRHGSCTSSFVLRETGGSYQR